MSQQIVHGPGRAGVPIWQQPLQFELNFGNDIGVEQAPQLGLTEQFGQQSTIEGECGRPPFGGRSVVLVHVCRDEVEGERRGERARSVERHVRYPHPAGSHVTQQLGEGREIEMLLQHLPVGLEHDGERWVVPCDLEQVGGSAPLQPQGSAISRSTAWK